MDSTGVSARNRRRLARERLLRFWLAPPEFVCPVCEYVGPFLDVRNRDIGRRLYGQCPRCNTRERHRLMRLVIADLARRVDLSGLRALHFSPEAILSPWLRSLAVEGRYSVDGRSVEKVSSVEAGSSKMLPASAARPLPSVVSGSAPGLAGWYTGSGDAVCAAAWAAWFRASTISSVLRF